MLGAIVIVLVILAIPPMILMSGMVVAAILGHTSTADAEARHEGSELIELKRELTGGEQARAGGRTLGPEPRSPAVAGSAEGWAGTPKGSGRLGEKAGKTRKRPRGGGRFQVARWVVLDRPRGMLGARS